MTADASEPSVDPRAELQSYRQSIDNIEAARIPLLAERFQATQAVGREGRTGNRLDPIARR
jgi:chorismate mutase